MQRGLVGSLGHNFTCFAPDILGCIPGVSVIFERSVSHLAELECPYAVEHNPRRDAVVFIVVEDPLFVGANTLQAAGINEPQPAHNHTNDR